jgi:multicomponent Na+:H+ antiporter subunit G
VTQGTFHAILGLLGAAFLVAGCMFMLLASIGILRMPDLYTRLQVTSKASIMGTACILLAVAFHFAQPAVTIRVVTIIAFFGLTIPVATHMIARAGYATNVALSKETVTNELEGNYDPETHTLGGEDPSMQEFEIEPDSPAIGKRVATLGMPPDVLIVQIHRQHTTIVPRGNTAIEAGDVLEILVHPRTLGAVRAILEAPTVKV